MFGGSITTIRADSLRMTFSNPGVGNFGAFLRNDGGAFYIMTTSNQDPYGTFYNINGKISSPFYYNLRTMDTTIAQGAINATAATGNVTVAGSLTASSFAGGSLNASGSVVGANFVTRSSAYLTGVSTAGTMLFTLNAGRIGILTAFDGGAIQYAAYLFSGGQSSVVHIRNDAYVVSYFVNNDVYIKALGGSVNFYWNFTQITN